MFAKPFVKSDGIQVEKAANLSLAWVITVATQLPPTFLEWVTNLGPVNLLHKKFTLD